MTHLHPMFTRLRKSELPPRLLKPAWAFLLLAALFSLALFIPSSPQARDDIGIVIHGHDHDIIGWEARNFFDKWLSRGVSIFSKDPTEEQAIADVREYARLTDEIGRIEGAMNRAVALGEPVSRLEEEWTKIVRQRDGLEARVEELIEAQISGILAEEGFSWGIGFLGSDGYLFPPVDFKYEDSPPALVLSPRERIELESTRLLTPGLGIAERQDIEEGVEGLDGDYSALVVNTGGVATFPAVVGASGNLQYTLRTVAHEWVHHYLIFYPLGRNYWTSGEMVAINETVANIAGDEIGDAVYERHYADEGPRPPAPIPGSTPTPPPGPPAFSFSREMRETRLQADSLLAQGQVEEAEAYMEKRRLLFADNGYFLRKLNQAYFAFYGSYADRPASVSPIGGQVKQIREQSASLKEFLETMAGVSDPGDLLSLVGDE